MLKNNRSFKLARSIYRKRVEEAVNLLEYQNEFINRNCPCCNQNNSKLKYDLLFNGYKIKECDHCLMKYVENIPNSLLLKKYYEKISEHNSYLWKRDRTTEFHEKLEVIKNIENFNKDFIIAELGCGNGQFVSFLSKSGFKSIGYELDSGLVNEGKKKGANVINANIMDTTFDHADIFLCYEIIEHLQEPRVFFQNLASLSYSHVIIITTPNINGFDNIIVPPQKDGRFLASAIFPPYHINGFSIHTLTNLLLSVGYSIKSIRTPGKLDVEIVLHDSDYFENEGFLPNSDQAKIIQKCVSSCNGSSHMEIIAKMN